MVNMYGENVLHYTSAAMYDLDGEHIFITLLRLMCGPWLIYGQYMVNIYMLKCG